MSKMKFEPLKGSKFGAFESHKLDNPLQVCGGEMHPTTYTQYETKDGGQTYQVYKTGVDRFDFGDGATKNDTGFPSTGAGDITLYSYRPLPMEKVETVLASA